MRQTPTPEEIEAYYSGKARQAAAGEAQNEKMRALRYNRRLQRLMDQGCTFEAADAHLSGACDLAVCTMH